MLDKHLQPTILWGLGSEECKSSGIISEIEGVLDHVESKGLLIE
jgi:hypothetical protein